jgi:ribonuclease E
VSEAVALPEAAPEAEAAEPVAEVADVTAANEESTVVAAEEAPAETAEVAAALVETPEPAASQREQHLAEIDTTGLTAGGRAINDPRVEARPVRDLEIVTSHLQLFSDTVAPAVEPGGKVAPRASNDPRGPLPEAEMAQAAGHS